jgi:hypothetical protein
MVLIKIWEYMGSRIGRKSLSTETNEQSLRRPGPTKGFWANDDDEWILCLSVFLPYLLAMQIASFLRQVILLSGAYMAVPYFSTLSHKGTIIGKKRLKTKCWFSLQLLSEIFHIPRRMQRDTITNVHSFLCTR